MKKPITLEVAKRLFDCVEMVTELACRKGDAEAFDYFNLTDSLLAMYPKIDGSVSEESKRLRKYLLK